MDDSLVQLITELLEKLDVQVEHIALAPGTRKIIAITSPESKRLIGPHGEHLRSLAALARRLAETKFGPEINFSIDVNGYYERQMEQVRSNARMLAQRARLFKYDIEMSPMSPYERLVIHELFAEDPEIETRSEGTGKFRHVVLHYRGSQQTTA